MKIKVIYTAWIFFSLLIFACHDDHVEKKLKDEMPPIPVTISTVAKTLENQYLTASGKVKASNTSKISTRMMGYIEQIYVKQGDLVKKDQLLVRINNVDLKAQKSQIEAGINEAKTALLHIEKDLNRYKALFENSSVTQKELDDITAQYNMAKSRLESVVQKRNEINAQFSYSNIKAPIGGIVSSKMANAGDLANPGMPILEIESIASLQVEALIPESEIAQIKMGLPAKIHIKALDAFIDGMVSEISPSSKYTGGQFLVKIRFDKNNSEILAGMYATVQFPLTKENQGYEMMIPLSSLVTKGQLRGVYTVSENDRALLRWLRLGKTQGDMIEVLSGLAIDEKYILSTSGRIINGSKISY